MHFAELADVVSENPIISPFCGGGREEDKFDVISRSLLFLQHSHLGKC